MAACTVGGQPVAACRYPVMPFSQLLRTQEAAASVEITCRHSTSAAIPEHLPKFRHIPPLHVKGRFLIRNELCPSLQSKLRNFQLPLHLQTPKEGSIGAQFVLLGACQPSAFLAVMVPAAKAAASQVAVPCLSMVPAGQHRCTLSYA